MKEQTPSKGIVVWFTGLSGAGKTTLAKALHAALNQRNFISKLLDGDDLRKGINNNLGFSENDRLENIRRSAEVAKLFSNSNIISICSFITPTNQIRRQVEQIVGSENHYEIFVNTPFETCEARDVKGLYKKARNGEIKNFTGIDAVFEVPDHPFLKVETEKSVEEVLSQILDALLPILNANNKN